MTAENQAGSRRGFRVEAIAAATLVAAALAIAPITPAHSAASPSAATVGSIGIRLVDVPQDALDDPRARQYIVDHLLPGTTIERRIEVSNSTDGALTIQSYAAAAAISGGSFVGSDGRTANTLSSWTSLSEPEVVVPANSSVVETVTVAVPADAAPGEQYAAIWVQTATDEGEAVQVVNRVGIRMYLSVGGDNAPASSFVVDSMTASRDDDGNAVVTAALHNTGGRALDASADLTIAAVTGTLSAGPYPAQLGTTIAPGDTQTLTVLIGDEIAAGPWTGTIVVTSGVLSDTFDAVLTFPEAGAGDPVALTAPTTIPTWLAIALAIGALLVISIGTLAVLRIRRRHAVHAIP